MGRSLWDLFEFTSPKVPVHSAASKNFRQDCALLANESASINYKALIECIHHCISKEPIFKGLVVPVEKNQMLFQMARPLDISSVLNKDDLQEVLLAKARASINAQKNFTMVLQLLLPDGSTELRFRASFRQENPAF